MEELWIRNIKFCLNEWEGKKSFDVREWYYDRDDGVKKPGKSGFKLKTMSEVDTLIKYLTDNCDEIKKYLEK